jgi:hypothetical protein
MSNDVLQSDPGGSRDCSVLGACGSLVVSAFGLRTRREQMVALFTCDGRRGLLFLASVVSACFSQPRRSTGVEHRCGDRALVRRRDYSRLELGLRRSALVGVEISSRWVWHERRGAGRLGSGQRHPRPPAPCRGWTRAAACRRSTDPAPRVSRDKGLQDQGPSRWCRRMRSIGASRGATSQGVLRTVWQV